MKDTLTNYLNQLSLLPHSPAQHLLEAQQLLNTQKVYTRSEGALHHFCCFIVPVHRQSKSVYIGHHRKADDWIPPGGHIEPNEDPIDTVIRESQEELDYKPVREQIRLFNFSSLSIQPQRTDCHKHYDFWFAVIVPELISFTYDTGEFLDAKWVTFDKAIEKLSRHRHYYEDTYFSLNAV